MEFTYDNKQNEREVVAFISDNGNLVIRNTDTGRFSIALCTTGSAHNSATPDISKAKRKFYTGDSLTITF